MGDAAARVAAAGRPRAALDRFFDTFYRQRPVAATFTGLHEHDGVLPDWSADGLARAADEMRALRRELDAAGRVPDAEVTVFPWQVDLALADGALEIALAEHESRHFVHAQPVAVDRRGHLRRAQPGHPRLRADWPTPATPLTSGSTRFRRSSPTWPDVLGAAPADWIDRARRECQAARALFGQALPAWLSRSWLLPTLAAWPASMWPRGSPHRPPPRTAFGSSAPGSTRRPGPIGLYARESPI